MRTLRRTMLFLLIAVFSVAVGCEGDPTGNDDNPLNPNDGLVTLQSTRGFDETFNRLRNAIEANDALSIIATVDHAANAQSVGMQLPPTRLIIFGNPNLGTPLMQSERTTGIDLPQKFLVWQDADGEVFVTYNDPAYLARRHNIEGREQILNQISMALRTLAEGATQSQ